MTLKERFIKLFPHQNEEYLDHEEAEMCEKIADDFAIEFTEWLCDYEITKEQIKTRLETFKNK